MKKQTWALALVLGFVLVACVQTTMAQATPSASPTPTPTQSPTPQPTIDEAAKIFSMHLEIVLAVGILVGIALLAYFGLRKEK
jgi:hypothetical protein